MDAKTDKVCDNFAVPSHIERRSEVKCAEVYSNETFSYSNATPHPNPSDRKVMSSSEFETTSFASPNALREETSLASVKETSFSPTDSSPALNYSLEESVRPCDSKTSPSIQTETPPAKVNASNFTTPAIDSSEEDGLPKVQKILYLGS